MRMLKAGWEERLMKACLSEARAASSEQAGALECMWLGLD